MNLTDHDGRTVADLEEDEGANGIYPLAAWEAVRQRFASLSAEPGLEDDDEPGEDKDADE